MLAAGIRRWASSGARHAKVCILGGGAGGVALGGKMVRRGAIDARDIFIIEGSDKHYYKPGWTLYSSVLINKDEIETSMESVKPANTQLIKQYVEKVDPKKNTVHLKDGSSITYDHLVISTGIQFNFDKIKGLKEALLDDQRDVYSVYHYETLEKMQRARERKFTQAIFTQPECLITCAGAPQKVLYLTHEAWANKDFRPTIKFIQGTPDLFKVPFYAMKLAELLEERGVVNIRNHNLIEVTPDNKAIFEHTKTKEKVEHSFDYLHAVPHMSGRDFLKDSGLVNKDNYVTLNKQTLRHTKYENVWGLGDGTDLPTSKTMSALIEQATVLEKNLTHAITKKGETEEYDGYTACPIISRVGMTMMAEFKYEHKIAPTFYKDQREPTSNFWMMKRYVFPEAALHLMHKGLWGGRRMFFGKPKDVDYTDFQKAEEEKYNLMEARREAANKVQK